MFFFDIQHIAFSLWGYSVSYLELLGAIAGLISVGMASRVNVLTWPSGIVNIICLTSLFYQTQLYPDMFLQIYYFIVTVYGWIQWNNKQTVLSITTVPVRQKTILLSTIILGTIGSGYFFSHIHIYFPHFFPKPSAFAYFDSFVLVTSMVAMRLMADKKIENWLLWVIVNIVCIALYAQKELYFLAVEYAIFLLLAIYGFIFWWEEMKLNLSHIT